MAGIVGVIVFLGMTYLEYSELSTNYYNYLQQCLNQSADLAVLNHNFSWVGG